MVGTAGQFLAWRDARREDRRAIQAFECTPPKPSGLHWRKPHPAPWELCVQSGIRTERPGKNDGSTFMLGLDVHGIGAVILAAPAHGAPAGYFKLRGIAVALRHRYDQGAHAREALAVSLEVMEGQAAALGVSEVKVHAHIDRRNWSSQRLFSCAGFEAKDQITENLREWVLDRALVDDEERPHSATE